MTRLLLLLAAAAVAGAAAWLMVPVTSPPPLAAPPGADSAAPAPLPVPELRPAAEPDVKLPAGISIQFADVTKAAGIDFQHFDGRTDMEYIMDQTGSGLAWIDYDQDGLL